MKVLTRPFRFVYINCFNRLRFLAEVSLKLQKMYFFVECKGHNPERKRENETNNPIFSSTFPL